MYGAILGDIIGSPYEFDRGDKVKDFPLFSRDSAFTDDTVMTVAVADALMAAGRDASAERIASLAARSMRRWGRKYPHAGYGASFIGWLADESLGAYGSLGNGAAMRVSAAGWLYDTLPRTLEAARAVTAVTHDHPEGIRGAETTAAVIYLARTGMKKEELFGYAAEHFRYELRSCAEIRAVNHHVETCMNALPAALASFFEGESFEDVIRNAVSLGGDTDTIAAIAGSMAEACYGVPDTLRKECLARIPKEMRTVVARFDRLLGR